MDRLRYIFITFENFFKNGFMGRRNAPPSSRRNGPASAASLKSVDEAIGHFSKNDRSKVLEMKVTWGLTYFSL